MFEIKAEWYDEEGAILRTNNDFHITGYRRQFEDTGVYLNPKTLHITACNATKTMWTKYNNRKWDAVAISTTIPKPPPAPSHVSWRRAWMRLVMAYMCAERSVCCQRRWLHPLLLPAGTGWSEAGSKDPTTAQMQPLRSWKTNEWGCCGWLSGCCHVVATVSCLQSQKSPSQAVALSEEGNALQVMRAM